MHTYIVFDIQAYNTNTLLLFLNKHFIDPIRSTLQHFCYVFFQSYTLDSTLVGLLPELNTWCNMDHMLVLLHKGVPCTCLVLATRPCDHFIDSKDIVSPLMYLLV